MKQYLFNILILILTPFDLMVHAQQFPELPGQVDNWSMTERMQITTREALYDYIDGGAELYLSYGFKSALSCRYTREGHPEVTAEIFDLGSAPDAFGLYSQTRDKEETDYGQGSYYVNGAQFFWKGRYWISLITSETTEESVKLLHTLAGYINEKINETGERPAILSVLPAEGLVPGGFLYFHHYIWLNSYYFIASDNILGIDENTPAVLAKYGPPEERLYLLGIQYPDSARAAQAYASFGEHYFPEGLKEGCIQLEDKTWLAAGLFGSVLVGIFNGMSREKTLELLGRFTDKLK
jgi:hypothetical protein